MRYNIAIRHKRKRVNSLRDWLIAIREGNGYSQKRIAELANISQPSYCNIEKGERNPTVETAKKIAEALGFDWTRFYDHDKKGA